MTDGPGVVVNDIEPERVNIPAGPGIIGSTEKQAEAYRNDARASVKPSWFDAETLWHKVQLDAIEIDKYPVTCAQYALFCAETAHAPPEYWDGRREPPSELRNHPVVCVSLEDAIAYCRWAGGRVPYEREWEKAARGEDGRVYPWGNEFDPANSNSDKQGNERRTEPVNAYPQSAGPYGVMDMVGNVQEWTLDYHVPYPAYLGESNTKEGAIFLPDHSVVRGGSFGTDRALCRCAARIPVPQDAKLPKLGFRCVYTPDPTNEVGQQLENGNIDEALRLVRKALTLAPHHPTVLYYAAMVSQRDEQFETAVALWERFLRFWPDNEDALTNVQVCRERM